MPSSSMPTVHNFRDVGQTVNLLLASPILREGFLYRSGRPDDASQEDSKALVNTYRIRSIIDLRSTTEHINRAKKQNSGVPSSISVPRSELEAANNGKIDGVRYNEINLNGGAFSRALLWRLRWSSLAKLLSLMTIGYRIQAISILGREVMAPRGLIGLGKDSLDHCTVELRRILVLLAEKSNYPLLVHCTQGKDRTGLVIILTLLLLDIPRNAISEDYLASERELENEKEERMKEITEIGLGDEFANCPVGFVKAMETHMKEKYGGT